ncbi:MAG: hypothetical protein HYV63_16690 [Candidatus Schekmanbacteria bacterium]|nr:hypothetical protein [Candidatus Schekmanbacteria bacterium]
MNNLVRAVALLFALAATGADGAPAPALRSALTSPYLRFRVSNGMNDRTNVIPEYKFATRFIGRVGLSNGSSVGPTPALRTRGASWEDFLRMEIWHDGERAESWLELTFDVSTEAKGLAIPQQSEDIRAWLKQGKLHPPTELRPDSGVSIPFEVRLRDGCPLRRGTYKIVAAFDPSIARTPALAWIARFTPMSAEWRVGLRPEEVLPRHRQDLLWRTLLKESRTDASNRRRLASFWLAEYEKDPTMAYLLTSAISYIDDWDEIERLLLRAIAWLEGGGRFSHLQGAILDGVVRTPVELVRRLPEQLWRLKADGKTQDDWHIYLGSEMLGLKLLRRDKVNENTVYPPIPPQTYPGYCQLPMEP